jgi:polar amino acid transport system substrate-binding protein
VSVLAWLGIAGCSRPEAPLPPVPEPAPDSPAPQGDVLTMVYTKPRTDPDGQWMYLVFSEAFRRAGAELVFEDYPAKRATFLAERGEVDGELGRCESYGEERPAMVRVDEPITTIRWMAHTVDPAIEVHGWDDLGGTLRIDTRRGLHRAEKRLADVVAPERLSRVDQVKQGLDRLLAGRSDVYVDMEEATDPLLAEPRFASVVRSPLGEEKLYAFLHERHVDFAPRLADALREVRADGLFETYEQLAALEAAPAAARPDHLRNGDFEASDLGAWLPVDGAPLARDGEVRFAGEAALRGTIGSGGDGRARALAVQPVSVEAGTRYDLGAMIRLEREGGFGTVEVRFLDANRRELFTSSLPVVVDAGRWIHRSQWVKTPTGAVEAEVRCTAAGAGEVWFDDVHFTTSLRTGY